MIYSVLWYIQDEKRLFTFFNIVDLYGSIGYWSYYLVVRTLDFESKTLTLNLNWLFNIKCGWVYAYYLGYLIPENCRFLWFYSLVVRTLDFESKSLSSNLNRTLNMLYRSIIMLHFRIWFHNLVVKTSYMIYSVLSVI